MKTKVLFRKFQEGDIIALFPQYPGTNDPRTCMSYMHIGQHGSADISLAHTLKRATEEEYQPLKKELESLGYDLNVSMDRCTKFDFMLRRDATR